MGIRDGRGHVRRGELEGGGRARVGRRLFARPDGGGDERDRAQEDELVEHVVSRTLWLASREEERVDSRRPQREAWQY